MRTGTLHRGVVGAGVAFGLVLARAGTASAQQDHATPEEVVQRVRQAARAIARTGEEAVITYSGGNATSVWKDSYVFVVNCDGAVPVTVAHPVRPESVGKPVAPYLRFGPRPGEQVAADYCAQGRKPHGGWVEYAFPRPGGMRPERKVTYLLAAAGTPYVAAAGVYDPTARIEDLDKLSGE